jgi:spore maturation protein CgeB
VRIVIFCHSLVSDWNHGNAHFLRGIATELATRGHEVRVFEPEDGWSRRNLRQDHGDAVEARFAVAYPTITSRQYNLRDLDLDDALARADLVLVHEWNDHDLVADIGRHHVRHGGYRLLFHDTHHRSVTAPESMAAYDLRQYDGVLAFGDVIRDLYLEQRWAGRAWTWHEAADTRVFYPRTTTTDSQEGDVVWIGNWGDEERTAEIDEFLIGPVRALGLRASVYGVRYPDDARARLAAAGIEYRGWLPNFDVPETFARFKATIHIPRRPYLEALPGVPTIRPFEALACGLPLVSARWDRAGDLFEPGEDFLVAEDGREMTATLDALLRSAELRARLARRGLRTIRERHTCAHRVDELLAIADEMVAAA